MGRRDPWRGFGDKQRVQRLERERHGWRSSDTAWSVGAAGFGDPECQALMVRLRSDLLPALLAACDGELASFDLRWEPVHSLVVVMAARGYPGAYAKGTEIRGIERAAQIPGVQVFHAGTTRREDGALIATGGRVLGITATGTTLAEAQAAAYAAVDTIDWPGGFCRRDIGWRAL